MTTKPAAAIQDGSEPVARPAPASQASRVAKARQHLIERGGRRLPTGYLQPDAAAALDALLAAGYAETVTGVIAAALLDAHRKIARRKP